GHASDQAIVVGQGWRRHPAPAGQIPGMTPRGGQPIQESRRAPGYQHQPCQPAPGRPPRTLTDGSIPPQTPTQTQIPTQIPPQTPTQSLPPDPAPHPEPPPDRSTLALSGFSPPKTPITQRSGHETTLERPPRASPPVGGLVGECAGPASDQAQLPGGAHGRGPVAHAELLVDMDQVGLHGGLADPEPGGHGPVGATVGDQAQH